MSIALSHAWHPRIVPRQSKIPWSSMFVSHGFAYRVSWLYAVTWIKRIPASENRPGTGHPTYQPHGDSRSLRLRA